MQHEPHRYANKGKSPRDTSISLHIEWANGMTSKHTYTVGQLRWDLTGEPFDIGYFWKAGDGK